jgi:arylsulfate sulfotransferase
VSKPVPGSGAPHAGPPTRRFTALRAAALFGLATAFLPAGCSKATLRNINAKPVSPVPSPPSSPPPTAGQSGSISISPQAVALAPGQKFQFTASGTGGAQTEWLVNGVLGGSASTGTVDSSGNFIAPATLAQSANVTVTVALAASPQQNYATAVVSIILPAQVTCPFDLGNPQVALYSIYLPAPGKAYVQFGQTTDYGLKTWQVPTPSPNGGGIQIYVAGMLGQSVYHMRAQVTLDDGAGYTTPDQTCTTGVPPTTSPVTVSVSAGATPQPGIEVWNTILPSGDAQAFATDLKGNVIWTYNYQHSPADLIQGIQLLPNGNLLMVVSYLSSLTQTQSSSLFNEVREINLAGDTVRDLTMTGLNQKLAAGNFRDAQGNLYQLGSFHHDVLVLPNGHWVLLATYYRTYDNLSGFSSPVKVTGDALVDVDQNMNPDWVWNTFDHLDINRHPMNFTAQDPDWTHGNGMLYSSDDHNLLFSMRHQNWIIKINFLDGHGSGDVMWRLGYQGGFKLVGGVDPTDWFYAQHGMSYFSPNTTGVFRIGLMDNGNDRFFPPPVGQVNCLPYQPASPQCYSTMPVYEINENNMTATLITHYVPPDTDFSFFGGNAELLDNNDIEVDFCAALRGALIQELNPQANQIIWQGYTPNADQFHAYRLPSLYPGVQW